MPSFKTSVAVLATVLFTLGVQAQKTYTIDPNNVPIATRGRICPQISPTNIFLISSADSWCSSQKSQCPLICLDLPGVTTTTTDTNSCNAVSIYRSLRAPKSKLIRYV